MTKTTKCLGQGEEKKVPIPGKHKDATSDKDAFLRAEKHYNLCSRAGHRTTRLGFKSPGHSGLIMHTAVTKWKSCHGQLYFFYSEASSLFPGWPQTRCYIT